MEQRREDLDRRGFARAVGADEAEAVARLDLEVQIRQRHERAVALGEVDGFDNGWHGGLYRMQKLQNQKRLQHVILRFSEDRLFADAETPDSSEYLGMTPSDFDSEFCVLSSAFVFCVVGFVDGCVAGLIMADRSRGRMN